MRQTIVPVEFKLRREATPNRKRFRTLDVYGKTAGHVIFSCFSSALMMQLLLATLLRST